MPIEKQKTRTIDMTPTWTEIAPVLVHLIEESSAEGRKTASEELMRMARLADMASIILGSKRRPDAPSIPEAEDIKAALDSWAELLAYEEDRPAAGTHGAELYAHGYEVLARMNAKHKPES